MSDVQQDDVMQQASDIPSPDGAAPATGKMRVMKWIRKIRSGFGGTFWPGIFILVILLILSFVVLGFRLADFAKRDDREVMLKSNMDADLDIFSATYKNAQGEVVIQGADGDKVIAPGSKVDYTVRLRNKDTVAIDYTLIAVIKTINNSENQEIEIPLEFRILDPEDNYIAGDAKTWVDRKALDGLSHTGTIMSGESAEYVFQWRWPFEGSDDELDTMLGNMADSDLGLEISFTLRSEANTSLAANGGFWGSGAGKAVLIILFALLLLLAIILLVIAYFKRKRVETVVVREPIILPTPVAEPEPVIIPEPVPEIILPPVVIRYSIPGKKRYINIDTLYKHFEDGATINLAALKQLQLVPASTKQIKVLARDAYVLDKAYHIQAQAASAQARKAIEEAGGSITIVRPDEIGDKH